MYSKLDVNPLQVFKASPDSDAYGFVTCKLCTTGNMTCTTLVHSGRSELIASHIHLADGKGGGDGATAEGPPVINFCGSPRAGLIEDGTPYPRPCEQWDTNGASHDRSMPGVLVENFNHGLTVADRVKDIAEQPGMYYFNFHSLASWNHWYPVPHGICRGKMELQSVDEV